MSDSIEPLAVLLRRCADHVEPCDVPRVSFADALTSGDDPIDLLPYLSSLGIEVRSLEDLLMINADDTEEEIHSFRVAEGVAVTVASDGLWVLFES